MFQACPFSLHTADPAEASRWIESLYGPTRVSPCGGAFQLRLEGAAVAGVTAMRVHNEHPTELVHRVGFAGIGLVFPCRGELRVQCAGPESALQVHTASLLAGGDSWRAQYGGPLRALVLLLGRAELEAKLAEQLGRTPRAPLAFEPWTNDAGPAAATLRSLVEALVDGACGDAPLLRSGAALASLREAILDLAVHVLPHNHSASLREAAQARALPRKVKRAVAFMREHVARPLTLADIAAAAGSSPRALQQAFQSFLGTSPMAYLRDLRLEGAHRDLCNPAHREPVAAIAAAWGFVHLSLFAAHYRQRFGRLPSETRRLR